MNNPFLERALEHLLPEAQRDLMLAIDFERRSHIDEIAAKLGLVVITIETHRDLMKSHTEQSGQ